MNIQEKYFTKNYYSKLWCVLLLRLYNWVILQLKFYHSKFVYLFLFVVVNVLVASLGVWMTMLMSQVLNTGSFSLELKKILAAGGPYTFAVAYLAASTSSVAYEYLDSSRGTNRRKSKVIATTAAFVLIILCTLLSGFQTQSQSVAAVQVQHSSSSESNSSLKNINLDHPSKMKMQLTSSERMQIWLVLISIIVGFYLYLISRWDDEDANTLLLKHNNRLQEEINAIGNNHLNTNSNTLIPNLE